MFSNLRVGSPFYILKKGENIKLDVGNVVNVGTARAKYNTNSHNMMEMVVDVTVKVGDESLNFEQLPCNLSIADFGQTGVVVSESRDAMMSEVESMRRRSEEVIKSVGYHEKVIVESDKMMKVLNPLFAKEVERDEEMNTLKAEVGEIRQSLSNMEGMLTKMINNVKNSKHNEND